MSVYDRIVELSRFDYANAFTCHDGIVRDQVARTYLDYPSAVYDEAYESGLQSHWPDSAALNIGNLGADVASWIVVCRPTFTYDNGGTGRTFAALHMSNGGSELTIQYSAWSSVRSWIATLRGSFTPASPITLQSVGSVTSNAQIQKVCVVVLTYDVAGEKNLYVDGELIATSTTTVGSLSTSQPFSLGGTTGSYWAGGIFAAHRVSSILTPEQVRDISASEFALFTDDEPLLYATGGATPKTITSSLDAYIQKAINVTSSLDALLQKQQAISASADSLVQKQIAATASLDSYVQKPVVITSQLDAYVRKAISLTSSLDAILTGGLTVFANLDVLVQKARTTTASLDAYLQKGVTTTTGLDAVLVKSASLVASLDVLLQKTSLAILGADVYVQKGVSLSAQIDAILSVLGGQTPLSRSFAILYDDRVMAIPMDDRTFTISAKD